MEIMTMRIPSLTALLVSIGGSALAGALTGNVTAVGQHDNGDAVVYVDQIAGKTFPAPTTHAKVDQLKLNFMPHVLAVLIGTAVDFENSDTVTHNVFTSDKCAASFNLGTWGKGQVKTHTFDKACAAELLCSLHPEMQGFVVAVPTPYFAVTDKTGAYEIKDVPDGTYTVKIWHPRLKKELVKTVTVKDVTLEDFKVAN
jgi:plastocyanin